MGHPPGSRNNDYDIKRRRLTDRCTQAMVRSAGKRVSLRDLASAANVSVSTMRHYFEDRDGIIEAVFETMSARLRPIIEQVDVSDHLGTHDVLNNLLDCFLTAWSDHNLAAMHAVGVTEGVHNARLGPKYVTHIVSPLVDCVEQVLQDLRATQRFDAVDLRAAATAFVSPILLVLAHQDTFAGTNVRPIDQKRFFTLHVEHYLAGWNQLAA